MNSALSRAQVTGHVLMALAMMGAIVVAAVTAEEWLSGAAAALLFLLPVLWVSARAGLVAGLIAAAAAALCYNFFLLEPRYTFRIHGFDDLAAFLVLLVVATVTSQLAAGLRAREIDAEQRATESGEQSALLSALAQADDLGSVDRAALEFLGERFDGARIFTAEEIASSRTGLAPLDASAAAWALHNGDLTGRSSAIMPTADFRFMAISAERDQVLALPAHPGSRGDEPEQMFALVRIWSQSRDRMRLGEVHQARQQLETRDQLRSTLLAALAHDFRTPLTVIKGGLAELPGEPARRLGAEIDRIARMSHDLITAAQLESGDMSARIEPVDLVDIVPGVLDTLSDARPEIVVTSTLAADLPLVLADPLLLRHMLLNLMDNAIRHATQAVTVSANWDMTAVKVLVEDDGPGLPLGEQSAVFDRFAQFGGGDRRGGSGLGLAIVKGLARAMNADVHADDGAHGGACFVVELERADTL